MAEPFLRLCQAVSERKTHAPEHSRTARLWAQGRLKIAQKLGEEAIEVGLELAVGDRQKVIEESADLLYHLAMVWAEMEVNPQEVWLELERREKLYGIAEKLVKTEKGK